MSKIKPSDFKGRFINMHTHTTRCQHAKGTDREYVESAIEAGLAVLGFSDHAPYLFREGYVSPIRMRMDELEGYVDSVLSLKKEYERDIEIYCGLEMEYFPTLFDKTMEEIDKFPIDYMILGQHFYDQEEGWSTPKRAWADEEHLRMYVEHIMGGLQTDRFFYVAHPDIICFLGEREIYRKHMLSLIQEMKRRDMPIEINMNGFRENLHYPTPAFIDLAIECDCEFIIGMDAHKPINLRDVRNYEFCKMMVMNRGGKLICERKGDAANNLMLYRKRR